MSCCPRPARSLRAGAGAGADRTETGHETAPITATTGFFLGMLVGTVRMPNVTRRLGTAAAGGTANQKETRRKTAATTAATGVFVPYVTGYAPEGIEKRQPQPLR